MSVIAHPGYMPGPVPVLQWEAEFTQLLDLYRKTKPRRVLEVGTYEGGTLYHWTRNAQPHAVVVSVDSYQAGVDNRHLYLGWTPRRVALHALDGDSHDPAVVRKARMFSPYDWVFIDAGHSYPDVKADWETYGLGMAATGGLVCFHDINAVPGHNIDVPQLWAEIRAEHETEEILSAPDGGGGGIGIVHL